MTTYPSPTRTERAAQATDPASSWTASDCLDCFAGRLVVVRAVTVLLLLCSALELTSLTIFAVWCRVVESEAPTVAASAADGGGEGLSLIHI